MMDRHPTDFFELLFGLAFLAAGGGFIVRQTTDQSVDPAWIAAIALVTIGCAFLALTVLRRPRPGLLAPTDRVDPLDPLDPLESSGERDSEGSES